MKIYILNFTFIILCFAFTQCENPAQNTSAHPTEAQTDEIVAPTDNSLLKPPHWAKDATIYEVNLRQYTEEQSFKSFIPHISRLKDMGIDILCFMPIYPISDINRDGQIGSYSAISDFTAVNTDVHGDLDDFREMVREIDRAGMKIILDFYPKYTGWDHSWISEYPEYYINELGNKGNPIKAKEGNSLGSSDIAELDYSNLEMQLAIVEEMKWWISTCDVNGFRMHDTENIPIDFWNMCVPELMKTKEVFLMADSESPHLRNVSGFAADSGWELYHLMNEIAAGKKRARDIPTWFNRNKKEYKKGYQIHFTTNYEGNSRSGKGFEQLAKDHEAFAILSATIAGMPMVSSGQEEPIVRKPKRYENDPIDFKNFAMADFYRSLLKLKKKNEALWNGIDGGEAKFIATDNRDIIAYSRKKDGNILLTIINLSGQQHSTEVNTSGLEGAYENVFGSSTTTVSNKSKFNLKPWDYLVLSSVE